MFSTATFYTAKLKQSAVQCLYDISTVLKHLLFEVTYRIPLHGLYCKHVCLCFASYKHIKTYHLLELCNAKSLISAIY